MQFQPIFVRCGRRHKMFQTAGKPFFFFVFIFATQPSHPKRLGAGDSCKTTQHPVFQSRKHPPFCSFFNKITWQLFPMNRSNVPVQTKKMSVFAALACLSMYVKRFPVPVLSAAIVTVPKIL